MKKTVIVRSSLTPIRGAFLFIGTQMGLVCTKHWTFVTKGYLIWQNGVLTTTLSFYYQILSGWIYPPFPSSVPSTRGQTKHPPGGKAVAAAWLPVCAEDLTRRQLLIPFWTNIRISTAIAANINHLHRKYKRIWTHLSVYLYRQV